MINNLLLVQKLDGVQNHWGLMLWAVAQIVILVLLLVMGVRLYFRVMLYLKKKIELTDRQLKK